MDGPYLVEMTSAGLVLFELRALERTTLEKARAVVRADHLLRDLIEAGHLMVGACREIRDVSDDLGRLEHALSDARAELAKLP